MREVRIDVDRQPMQVHPVRYANADGGDLVLETVAFLRPAHPDADAILTPFAAHVETAKRPDNPFLETDDKTSHVRPAPLQVEHHIGHALAGAVIGHLSAAPAFKHRKARVEHIPP